MAKSKQMAGQKRSNKQMSHLTAVQKPTAPSRRSIHTLSDLRNDTELWYKVRLLIYDLRNMAKDKRSVARTLQTTDPQHISAPYFSDEEAAVVKNATLATGIGVQQAIGNEFRNFVEKRQASADFRPCGPHDMVPVYLKVFGMEKAEIEEEKFVARVRRSGVGG